MTFAEFVAKARACGVKDNDLVAWIDISEPEFTVRFEPYGDQGRLVEIMDGGPCDHLFRASPHDAAPVCMKCGYSPLSESP